MLDTSRMYIWEAYNIKCLTSFFNVSQSIENHKNQVGEKRQLLTSLVILLALHLSYKINMCLFLF